MTCEIMALHGYNLSQPKAEGISFEMRPCSQCVRMRNRLPSHPIPLLSHNQKQHPTSQMNSCLSAPAWWLCTNRKLHVQMTLPTLPLKGDVKTSSLVLILVTWSIWSNFPERRDKIQEWSRINHIPQTDPGAKGWWQHTPLGGNEAEARKWRHSPVKTMN